MITSGLRRHGLILRIRTSGGNGVILMVQCIQSVERGVLHCASRIWLFIIWCNNY